MDVTTCVRVSSTEKTARVELSEVFLEEKSVANHLKMNEEQQTFLASADKCRNTCVQRNAMFTNMEKTIYHAIACDNSLIFPEVQDMVREQNNTGVSKATISRKLRKRRRWIESARLREPFI
ncbi:hypothetical protein RF11_02142 [Thelohanellus kitauei]|uniref:Uncharacterized protein n=1 Tax=Thelohanellus kitauei TaxID=669202 RepID=A0A0C2MG27_THEKT|nr:hypothetical protein RF11_02142 [Thelohanellus kitauei]